MDRPGRWHLDLELLLHDAPLASRSTVSIDYVHHSPPQASRRGGQDSISLGDGGSGGCVVLAKQSARMSRIQISGSHACGCQGGDGPGQCAPSQLALMSAVLCRRRDKPEFPRAQRKKLRDK